MKIQSNPHSLRVRQFVTSELFSLMIDVAAAYNSNGYRSYCTIVLAHHVRLTQRHARLIVDREIQRRVSASARTWTVYQASVGGVA